VTDDTTTLASEQQQHITEPPSTNADVSNISGRHQQQRRRLLFFTIATFGGMGVATFGVLAGGKVGYALSAAMSKKAVYGAVDIAINIAVQIDPARFVTVPPGPRKRGAAWFAIAILSGSANALWFISFDATREGTR